MARMKAPPGTTAITVAGKIYAIDRRRLVEVPDDAVIELVAHGFVVVDERPAADMPRIAGKSGKE